MQFKQLFVLITFMAVTSVSQTFAQAEEILLELSPIKASEGLSSNVVTAVFEDDFGFIWVGTYDGLNRLDGYGIETFRDEFYDNPACQTNRIYRLASNATDQLWISKDEGAILYDLKADSILDFNMAMSQNPARFAGTTPDGTTILTNNKAEILKYNHLTNETDRIKVKYPQSSSGAFPYTMNTNQIDSIHFALVSNHGEVKIYNASTDEFSYHPPNQEYGREFRISTVDGDGTVWIGGNKGRFTSYNRQKDIYTDWSKQLNVSSDIMFLYYDELENKIWICTRNDGTFTLNYKTQEWKKYYIKAKDTRSLHSETVMGMVRDHQGALWFGTLQNGILVYDKREQKFESINTLAYDISQDIRYPRSILEDSNGDLWIGTSSQGLWRYQPDEDKLTLISSSSHPRLMPNNSAISLMEKDGILYVGHNSLGITKFRIDNLKFVERLTFKSTSREITDNNSVRSMLYDDQGRLWAGTIFAGLYLVDGNTTEQLFKESSYLTTNRDIFGIKQLKNGKILIHNRIGGLYEYEESTKSVTKVYPKNNEQLAVKSFYESNNGNIWLATDGKGVLVLNDQYEVLRKFNKESGQLNNNVVCAVQEDANNKIWVSTNDGLTCLRFDNKDSLLHHHTFSMEDGLLSNEFMTGVALQKNNQIWFGNIDGINYWDLDATELNQYNIQTYIPKYEINDIEKSIDKNHIDLDKIELKPKDYSVSIYYNTLGYTIPRRTSYQYRLLGQNEDWSLPTSRTYVSYNNLEPGEYTFEVKANNYDGKWSDQIKSLSLIVKPAYYETIWFKILIGLGILLLGYLYNQYSLQQVRKREEEQLSYEKELSKMEMRALRAQINPHFLFNTLNSINNYILQNRGDKASKYLVKFSKLMRKILSNSSASLITISEELESLELYIGLESMRFGESFDYFVNVASDVDINNSYTPPMLIQPFVENAIWHGLMHSSEDKELEIRISKSSSDRLLIKVKDNGIGREAAKSITRKGVNKKSYGMQITQKRLALLNQQYNEEAHKSEIHVKDLTMETDGTLGTEITIEIPIIQSENKK